MHSSREQLRQALQLMRAGDLDGARAIVSAVLRTEPQNADAWFAGSLMTDEPERKRWMLEQALTADPAHTRAAAALAALGETQPRPTPPTPARPTPTTARKTTTQAMRPAAQRRSNTPYIVAGVVALVLLIGVVIVGISVASQRQREAEALAAQTVAVPTLRPTLTPPPTVPTPTASETPPPSAAPTVTHTPTATFTATAPPYGQTATRQWFDYLTFEALERDLFTAAALTYVPPG